MSRFVHWTLISLFDQVNMLRSLRMSLDTIFGFYAPLIGKSEDQLDGKPETKPKRRLVLTRNQLQMINRTRRKYNGLPENDTGV